MIIRLYSTEFVKLYYNNQNMKWYLCKYCNVNVTSDKRPSSLNCSINKTHYWSELCDVGPTYYYCYKCNTLIRGPIERKPSSLNCPGGSNTNHVWTKLGNIGLINYQCHVCGTFLKCDKLPSSFGCKNNSMHKWRKI